MGNNDDELKSIFKQAAEIASVVPESMHEAAFNKALDHLLSVDTRVQHRNPMVPKQENQERSYNRNNTNTESGDLTSFDSTSHPEVPEAATVLEKSLHILKIAKDELGIDGLTPTEISTILTEQYRLLASPNQVSDKIGQATGKFVSRIKEGKAYRYRIMAPGEKALISGSVKAPIRSNKKTSSNKSAVSNSDRTTKSTIKKVSSGRMGPKALVENLMAEGYLDEGRTISEIIQHVSHETGYTYTAADISTTMLRKLRAKNVTRIKDENGQFRYSKA